MIIEKCNCPDKVGFTHFIIFFTDHLHLKLISYFFLHLKLHLQIVNLPQTKKGTNKGPNLLSFCLGIAQDCIMGYPMKLENH